MVKRASSNIDFGSCCKDLREAMTQVPNSFFRESEEGVFYMVVGYAQTREGTGFFDQAVIFCPFCGTRLQNRDVIATKAHTDTQGDLPERFALPATARWFNTVQATTRIDSSQPLAFSYFFYCGNGADINALRARLESEGFKFVGTHVESERDKRLEVDRKEIHSPESLVERNRQFRSLAAEFHNVQYDGYEITLHSR